jgi:hypothetical protein
MITLYESGEHRSFLLMGETFAVPRQGNGYNVWLVISGDL